MSSGGGGGALAASSPARGGENGAGGGDTAATATTEAAAPGEAKNEGEETEGEANENENGDDDDVRFIACTPSSPLISLLGTFLSNSVHRVYVCDDLSSPRPTAVVTPTDVFRVLAGVF